MDLPTKTATNVKLAVPFFRVSNIEASVRYYVEGLGFELTKKWIDEGKLRWCWLQIGDAALMLARVPQAARRPGWRGCIDLL
jgi:catechol 2,3-dioxygenase-like lactoylglutathione lyase family enzyme